MEGRNATLNIYSVVYSILNAKQCQAVHFNLGCPPLATSFNFQVQYPA